MCVFTDLYLDFFVGLVAVVVVMVVVVVFWWLWVWCLIFFFFCGFGGYGGDDGVCGGGLGFLFVCGFGCNYGLWLKWRFGSCGCGCHSFGGCGCVGWWFFFSLPWAVVEVVAGGVVVEVVVAG